MSTLRNRTKEFVERSRIKGRHRFEIRDANGSLMTVFECQEYAPGYKATLRVFLAAAKRLEEEKWNRKTLAATWKWELLANEIHR